MKKLEESYDVWYNTDTEEIKSIMPSNDYRFGNQTWDYIFIKNNISFLNGSVDLNNEIKIKLIDNE